jgi:hypothetical protein
MFRAYQEISDDSPPTMSSVIGSFVTSLRPDRAFSSTPVNTPKELFKNQYVERPFGPSLGSEVLAGQSKPVSFSYQYWSLPCVIAPFLRYSWKT